MLALPYILSAQGLNAIYSFYTFNSQNGSYVELCTSIDLNSVVYNQNNAEVELTTLICKAENTEEVAYVDKRNIKSGIKDANNMGAAMAPAAYETISTHLNVRKLTINDFDLKDVDLSKIDFNYLDIQPFLSMVEQMEIDMSQVDMTNMMAMFGFDDMSNLQKKLMEGFLTEEQVLALKQAYVDTMAANNSLSATLETLGYSTSDSPSAIYFYPRSFESKEKLNELINYYNEKVTADGHDEYAVKCTDLIGVLMSSITTIIDILSLL